MNFEERAASRKKIKSLKNELKALKKEMLSAGGDKAQVNSDLKELQEALELGDSLHRDYEAAAAHLERARAAIEKLLAYMGESPAAEAKESLEGLIADLEQVYHDCSIREDDLDFQSTVRSLKQMTGNYSEGTVEMTGIMLRSELENVGAVLDDASGWSAPDFLALAYFLLHEDGDSLKEMENEQRNAHVLVYSKARFLDGFIGRCRQTGVEGTVRTLIQSYIYE